MGRTLPTIRLQLQTLHADLGTFIEVDCDVDQTNGADSWRPARGGTTFTCPTATDGTGPDATVNAGDTIQIYDDASSTLSGKTLRILDSNANSVILKLVVG